MLVEKKTPRKVRSDKKRDIKPTVHESLYECISRISYITNTPVKDVSEYLCEEGLNSQPVIEALSPQFRRNFTFNRSIFIGDKALTPQRAVRGGGLRRRLSMRFQQGTHDQIGDLAYALDVTISSATALLLEASVKNTDILDIYVAQHVTESLDPARQKQLKAVLTFIRKNNPYTEEITLPRLISYIVDGVIDHTVNIKKSIEDWLDSIKS